MSVDFGVALRSHWAYFRLDEGGFGSQSVGHFGVTLELRFASEDGLGYLLGHCGATLKSPLRGILGLSAHSTKRLQL